jgi:hypothetical protein
MSIATLFVIIIALLSMIPVHAADDDVVSYYVDLNLPRWGNQCEDGSMQCPFSSVDEALDKGYREICEGQPFWVYVKHRGQYEYANPIEVWGKKPVPGMGLPLARVAQIVILALAGLVLLALALRLQRRKAAQ